MADDTSKFLARGATVLGIAAFAQSRKIDSWQTLAPALRHPVKKLAQSVATSDDVVQMAKAVLLATTQQQPTHVSDWIRRCIQNPKLLTFVGDNLSFPWPLCEKTPAPGGFDGGLLALATALCRNESRVAAACRLFFDARIRTRFCDAAKVAFILAKPGQPTALRKQIKVLENMFQQRTTQASSATQPETDNGQTHQKE
ncbi:MAG: hypothetical protein JXR76_29675 [Deltaproteobacteria bacterium]|nr:hypothetical protein [Deltaproteobacteria bacterium]